MRQFGAIVSNTFLEAVRQPIYGLVLTVMCVLIAFLPAMAAHIFTFDIGTDLHQSANRMIADMGLSTVLLAGLILAVFSASCVISHEIENKTALSVLSKRVGRTGFIFGKFFGIALAIGLASITGVITVLLTVRGGATTAAWQSSDWGVFGAMAGAAVLAVFFATFRNYYRGRAWIGSYTLAFVSLSFILLLAFSLFDHDYRFILSPAAEQTAKAVEEGSGSLTVYDWDVARAGVLTTTAVLVMSGVAVAASTRLAAAANFVFCSFIFLGGLISEFLRDQYANSIASKIASYALPNLQTFWMSEPLARERPISFDYLGYSAAYGACYVLAMLFIAAALFHNRDIT